MNKVILIGRTTKDIDLRYTNSEKAVAQFTLAVNRRNKDEADFIRCIAWEKTAEVMEKYVKKGHRISIVGHIQTGSYEKDGQRIYTTDVVVENLEFLETKSQENSASDTDGWQEVDETDLPF